MIVVVCGSRGWRDSATIRVRLERLPSGTLVIVGGAAGADRVAESIARELGFGVRVERARWRDGGVYNPLAGFERNTRMLDMSPELVIAFWDGESRGTKDTLDKAWARGIACEVIYPGGYPSGPPSKLFAA